MNGTREAKCNRRERFEIGKKRKKIQISKHFFLVRIVDGCKKIEISRFSAGEKNLVDSNFVGVSEGQIQVSTTKKIRKNTTQSEVQTGKVLEKR